MRYALFHIVAVAASGILVACNLMGNAKVRPVVKVGPPAAALKTAEDEARVAALVPPDGGYANRVTSISLHVSGACISDSVGVLVKVPSAGTSLTLVCDPSTNEFSGEIDLSGLPDGQVQIQFGFVKSLESELPVYELTRTVTKDTESLPAFTLPSSLTDSGGVIAVDPVDGAVLYRATFTPQSGGGPTVTVEETSPSIPVASLTVGTTYSLSFAAIDGAGNETVASNTPTFTRLFTIKAQLVSLPPGIASPVQFYRFTGPWTSNCTDGFVSCNPNMNVTIGRTTISVGVGQTVTVGSGLTTSDMYYFSIVGGQRIDCVADTGSPALWEYVTGSATIKVVCNLDPPNPVSLAAAATSSSQVDLSWTSGGGFTMGYRIAYKSGATAPNDCSTAGTGITLVGEGSITGTSYSVTGLTSGTQYAFRVCATDGTTTESPGVTATATTQSSGGGSLQLASGRGSVGHVCAIVNGGVKCWGANDSGQLGNNSQSSSSSAVQAIAASSGVTDLTTGSAHTCAVVSGGLKCWGIDNQYQVGDGATANLLPDNINYGRLTPYQVIAAGSGVTKVLADTYHTCAIVSGGVKCWGMNTYGQVGGGPSGPGMYSSAPGDAIGSGSGVTDISISNEHVCALFGSSGKVNCWGRNDYGQIGNNSTTDTNSATEVISSGATSISVGNGWSCAVVSGGVKCWGLNANGRLGVGDTTDRQSPTTVTSSGGALTNVTAVQANDQHACAVVSGGVYCWGGNYYGQVGDGTTVDKNQAVSVIAATSGVTAVYGSIGNSCALVGGSVQCWGAFPGDGNTSSAVPAAATGLSSGFASVFMNYVLAPLPQHFTCAASSSGVKCWGYNASGQLGNGSISDSNSPVSVSGVP